MFRTIILLSIAGAALADDSDLIAFCCSEATQAELGAAGAQCGPVDDNGEPVNVQAADFDQSLWSTGAINAQCFACWNEETNSLDVEQAGCDSATDSNGDACNDPEGFCVKFANENQAAACWTPEIGTACSLGEAVSEDSTEDALLSSALRAAAAAMGLNAEQVSDFAAFLEGLPENSPLETMVQEALEAAFGETAPSIEALTATMETVFTSAAFSTTLGDIEGVDASLLAAVTTAIGDATESSGAAGLALNLAVVAMAAAALL